MGIISKAILAYKAVTELGPRSVGLNALYRFGLLTGHYRRSLNAEVRKLNGGNWTTHYSLFTIHQFTSPPATEIVKVIGEEGKADLLAEADEIVAGKVRLFGAGPVDLNLRLDGPLHDWTAYETGRVKPPVADIKFLWEPARVGWAFTLGRAYHLTGNDKYPTAFWTRFEEFTAANPPYGGPNWMSGQEAALRLMAFAWAAQVFAGSPASTPARLAYLAASIAVHAMRIPPTLVYARSQRNNHLLVEAAGLLTAGLALPDHPRAEQWRALGWKWFTRALPDQIDGYGEYSQHSTNYHRLMLQTVLWVNMLTHANNFSQDFNMARPAREAILRSVHWLLALLDADSGHVPNLGANDGAYIFPLTVCPFADFRPVLHAAARAFLDYDLPHGTWDELSLWFGIPLDDKHYVKLPRYLGDQLYGKDSWAYLRTAQFTTRPSHADQLHLDLWWRGLNIALDAGAFLYNAEPPWDNRLTAARVHNTVTVNGQDQMTRAGRFLYLDWVDAYRQDTPAAGPEVLQQSRGRYRNSRAHYRHSRRVSAMGDGRWQIVDELIPLRWLPTPASHRLSRYRLHWLLPDWEWEIEHRDSTTGLRLQSPHGRVTLSVEAVPHAAVTLVRAGELLYSCGDVESLSPEPIRGWVSPTYGLKVPALSLAVEIVSADDVQFTSEFHFP